MNNKMKIVAGLALLSLIPTAAMARTNVSVGVNLGGGYYEPAPVYVAPPPPRVYYYEQQPRAYYGPSVRYEYYGHDRYDRDYHHRDYGHHRGHDRDRDGR